MRSTTVLASLVKSEIAIKFLGIEEFVLLDTLDKRLGDGYGVFLLRTNYFLRSSKTKNGSFPTICASNGKYAPYTKARTLKSLSNWAVTDDVLGLDPHDIYVPAKWFLDAHLAVYKVALEKEQPSSLEMQIQIIMRGYGLFTGDYKACEQMRQNMNANVWDGLGCDRTYHKNTKRWQFAFYEGHKYQPYPYHKINQIRPWLAA